MPDDNLVKLWRAVVTQAAVDVIELPEMAISTSDWMDALESVRWWCRGGQDMQETIMNAQLDPASCRAVIVKRLTEAHPQHLRAAKELESIAADFAACGMRDDAVESKRIAGFRLDLANTISRELHLAV